MRGRVQVAKAVAPTSETLHVEVSCFSRGSDVGKGAQAAAPLAETSHLEVNCSE